MVLPTMCLAAYNGDGSAKAETRTNKQADAPAIGLYSNMETLLSRSGDKVIWLLEWAELQTALS